MKEQETTETFPLAEMAMNFLRKGEGGALRFCPEAPKGIQAALDALFASGASARPALEELIRLVCVLQDEPSSNSAALVILNVLSGDPRAIRALGGSNEEDARYVRSRLSQFFGESLATAPKVGTAAPSGALKASSLNASRPMRPPARAKKKVAKRIATKAPKTATKRGPKKARAVISADGVVLPQR